MAVPRILVAVSDVFFYTKIRDAFKDAYTLDRARAQGDVESKLSGEPPAAAIVNLNDEKLDAFQVLADIRRAPGGRELPVLAFANHEEVDTWKRAREMGANKIVSRNEFSSRTRTLIEELMGEQATPGSTPRPA